MFSNLHVPQPCVEQMLIEQILIPLFCNLNGPQTTAALLSRLEQTSDVREMRKICSISPCEHNNWTVCGLQPVQQI
jgi:hypothetical protein